MFILSHWLRESEITGKVFNYLKPIDIHHIRRHVTQSGAVKYVKYWNCECLKCGGHAIVAQSEFIGGKTKSCGCLRSSVSRIGNINNLSSSKLYKIYRGIVDRCYRNSSQHYNQYGGRGIYIVDEWYTPGVEGNPGFVNFYNWSMENGYRVELSSSGKNLISIDRKDNDGPYAPWNCRWVDKKTQGNNRSTNRYITVNGITDTLKNTSIRLGIPYKYFDMKLSNSWSLDAVAYDLEHPELHIRKKKNPGNKPVYVDKDGFMILVPKTQR